LRAQQNTSSKKCWIEYIVACCREGETKVPRETASHEGAYRRRFYE